ncbi:hypothetical protein FGD77_03175 [Roseovarius sp. M141]|nr:hypothetical protein [Roseovarius sp. M141]
MCYQNADSCRKGGDPIRVAQCRTHAWRKLKEVFDRVISSTNTRNVVHERLLITATESSQHVTRSSPASY